jgi:hypothetical protein
VGDSQHDEGARGSLRRTQWWRPAAPDGTDASAGADRPEEDGEHQDRTRSSVILISALVLVLLAVVVIVAVASPSSSQGSDRVSTLGLPSRNSPIMTGGGLAPLTSLMTTSAGPTPSTTKPSPPPTTTSRPPVSPTTVYVTPPPGITPVGDWALAGGSGTVALDVMNAHPATTTDVLWTSSPGVGGYAIFGGKDSQITTSGPVLNTAQDSSFTVAAWVYLTSAANFATAVSQDGVKNSGFYLQYSGVDNRWAFSRVTSDQPGAPGVRALSTNAPALNTWVHLVGEYDAGRQQLRLYVNGTLEGTKTYTTPYAANGVLAIGRAQFSGQNADWFPGAIRDVKVFDQALTTSEVDALS